NMYTGESFMSRFEWEKGEFVIPSAEYAAVKQAVREAHNKLRETAFDLAGQIHAEMTGQRYKGKRNVRFFGDYNSECEVLWRELLDRQYTRYRSPYGYGYGGGNSAYV